MRSWKWKIKIRLEALRQPGDGRPGGGGRGSGGGSDPSPLPSPILPIFGGLPSPSAFLTESFPSLDNLFDEEDNELQALQPQAAAVIMAASQPRIETDHNRLNISLIDWTNNVAELMPKVKKKPPPELILLFQKNYQNYSQKLMKKWYNKKMKHLTYQFKTLIKFLLK